MVVLYEGLVLLYVCRTNSSPVCSNGGCPESRTSSLVYRAGSPVCKTGSSPMIRTDVIVCRTCNKYFT